MIAMDVTSTCFVNLKTRRVAVNQHANPTHANVMKGNYYGAVGLRTGPAAAGKKESSQTLFK
jgi:hypothetical protein